MRWDLSSYNHWLVLKVPVILGLLCRLRAPCPGMGVEKRHLVGEGRRLAWLTHLQRGFIISNSSPVSTAPPPSFLRSGGRNWLTWGWHCWNKRQLDQDTEEGICSVLWAPVCTMSLELGQVSVCEWYPEKAEQDGVRPWPCCKVLSIHWIVPNTACVKRKASLPFIFFFFGPVLKLSILPSLMPLKRPSLGLPFMPRVGLSTTSSTGLLDLPH